MANPVPSPVQLMDVFWRALTCLNRRQVAGTRTRNWKGKNGSTTQENITTTTVGSAFGKMRRKKTER